MRHESSSATRTTAVNACDEIASKLLASVVPTNLTAGSLVTSINQSGGQTAQAITNIHRQVVLDRSYPSEQLTLDTFAIDPAQCAYEEHRLDASRPFWPDCNHPLKHRH